MQSYMHEHTLEAGVDEAGRGPALGRIYAAAVIWPANVSSPLVRDSKTIKENQMQVSYDFVLDNALDYAVAYATEEEIDQKGVGNANMMAMHRAVRSLTLKPELLLVDGNYFQPYFDAQGETTEYETVVGGDRHYYSIAAASILAKYSRDKYIEELCEQYPELVSRYDLRKNKGYPGAQRHANGIKEHGICQFHRRSWKTCNGHELNPVSCQK